RGGNRAGGGPVKGAAAAPAHARAHRGRTGRTLEGVVQIPSLSAAPGRGGEVRRCAGRLAELLCRIGLDRVRVVETARHPLVYGEGGRRAGPPTGLGHGPY